ADSLQRGRARWMMRLAAGSALAVLTAACAQVGSPQSASALPREAFDYVGWDQYLGGAESAQYSALAQIDKSNVGQLQVAWEYQAGDGAAPQFNPIVANGMMYVQRGNAGIAALDPATGREIWQSEAK